MIAVKDLCDVLPERMGVYEMSTSNGASPSPDSAVLGTTEALKFSFFP